MPLRLTPDPIKKRPPVLNVECCQLDVLDGTFVAIDVAGGRTHIPVGGLAYLMLEPGIQVSHAACKLAAQATLLVWVGEAGVRLYSSGQPGGARADKLLYQERLALDKDARLKVVRQMYRLRFNEEPPQRRSVEQLRGIEGPRGRAMYHALAKQYGVTWRTGNYDHNDCSKADLPYRGLSAATTCLYGVTEAAALAAGYAQAIGFIHIGKPLSFVNDVGDIYKFEIRCSSGVFRCRARRPPGRGQRARALLGVLPCQVARTDHPQYLNRAGDGPSGNGGSCSCRGRSHSACVPCGRRDGPIDKVLIDELNAWSPRRGDGPIIGGDFQPDRLCSPPAVGMDRHHIFPVASSYVFHGRGDGPFDAFALPLLTSCSHSHGDGPEVAHEWGATTKVFPTVWGWPGYEAPPGPA